VAIFKARKGLSPEPNCAGTLILSFQFLEKEGRKEEGEKERKRKREGKDLLF
jgi:hypothetical protein